MTDPVQVSTAMPGASALPGGFQFSAMRCGIKQGRPDLGMIRSVPAATCAGAFTRNLVRAACVRRNAELVPSSKVSAIVVNSGNANAMTGKDGVRTNAAMASGLATVLEVDEGAVLTASTGVIGTPLPVELVLEALPALVEQAGTDPLGFAAAVLTTDTCKKVAHVALELPGASAPVKILGIAKGSGMIHPNMATTLGFVCTDAAIAPELLQRMLSAAIEDTFNAVTVDGDTSTSDQVFVLANGTSGVAVEGASEAAFASALSAVLTALAKQVARDGEGATRLFEVEVTGAPSFEDARTVARTVCRSSLVKCSVFAGQPDWGRVAMAAGQAGLEHGIAVDPDKLTIRAQGIALYTPDGPVAGIRTSDVTRRLREPEVRWSVDLGLGDASFVAYGCDMSYDYVRINADETQQVQVTPDGGVSRNLSLAAYSPRLKHQLLVDGLAYVRRFMGLRMMVYVPPTTRGTELVNTLGQDLALCLDAGLRPLLVVPSESMAEAVLERARAWGHYAATVAPDPSAITRLLDRSHLCVLVRTQPVPTAMVDLAIKLGMQKLIAMGDEQGVRDAHGLVQRIDPDGFLLGLERQRFELTHPDTLVLAKHAAQRGVPALHIVDARVPHAIVGELFTDEGIGTLVTRQAG
jgi:glutamate N-acetyltransferase/amino-acid acetyltransferase